MVIIGQMLSEYSGGCLPLDGYPGTRSDESDGSTLVTSPIAFCAPATVATSKWRLRGTNEYLTTDDNNVGGFRVDLNAYADDFSPLDNH